jgi:hypothetical protein
MDRANGTPCGAKDRHCSGSRLLDGDTCQNGVCAAATTGKDCGFECRNDMCIDTPPCKKITCFVDADGDGFGDPTKSVAQCDSCGVGTVSNKQDCCDRDPKSNPNASQNSAPNGCGSFDWNCDGRITVLFDRIGICANNPSGCCANMTLPVDQATCGSEICISISCVADEIFCDCINSSCAQKATQSCK